MHVPRLPRSALAVFAASILFLASIQTALGSVGYKYAHQWTLSGTNGIDGYIRASGRSGLDNPSDHIAFWMNLGDSVEWIQTGEYQGAIGTISSQSHLDKYAESTDGCGTYESSDFQAPARPNYAYYITWTGSSSVFSCPWGPLTQYKFEVRFGSLSNPPSGIPRWMPYSANHPDVATETYSVGNTQEAIGDNYYGLNDTQQVDAGYAIHFYTKATNSWLIWDNSWPAGVQSNDPPYYNSVVQWSSFHTRG